MIEPTTDRGRKLAALSQRLRVLHAEMAEVDPAMRAEQLRDEVQRAVSQLNPDEREGFLLGLLEQFPDIGGAPVVVQSVAAPAAPMDPRAMAEKLAASAAGMSEAERAAITQRLIGAGFAVRTEVVKEAPQSRGGGAFPAGALTEFKKTVGVSPEAAVDPARLVEAASMLAEFALKLEPWACTYWRDMAPDAKNAVYQTLNKDIARYVQGDEGMTKDALARNVYKLRSLVSLLMKGVSEAGKQYARDHLSRYAVEAVKAAAPKETFKSDEYRCWKQYERLMEGVDAAAIEKRLKSLIAKDVDTALSQVVR